MSYTIFNEMGETSYKKASHTYFMCRDTYNKLIEIGFDEDMIDSYYELEEYTLNI